MFISFVSYFVYLILAVGAFFLVKRFAKGDALHLLTLVMLVACLVSPNMELGQYFVSCNVVFAPVLIMCMIACYKQDAIKGKNMFFNLLFIVGAVFVITLVAEVVSACQGYSSISWWSVGGFISLAVSLTVALVAGKYLCGKLPQNNFLFKFLFLFILCAIEQFIFSVLRLAFVPGVSFNLVFVGMLYSLLFVAGSALVIILVEEILLPMSLKNSEKSVDDNSDAMPEELVVEVSDVDDETAKEEIVKQPKEQEEPKPKKRGRKPKAVKIEK